MNELPPHGNNGPTDKGANASAESRSEQTPYNANASKPAVRSTIPDLLIVFLTGVIAATSYLQWKEIGKSNRINHEALVSVQRALVTFSFAVERRAILNPKTNKVVRWDLMVPMQNSGVTPTMQMVTTLNFYSCDTPLPDNFEYRDYGSPLPTILGPKEKTLAAPFYISPEVIQGVRDRKKHLYFYGWTTYHDIFKDTPLHITEFCFELEFLEADPYTGKGNNYSFYRSCPRHNCIDEECKKEKTPSDFLPRLK